MDNKKLILTFLFVSMILIGIIPSINIFMNQTRNNSNSLFNTDVVESLINFFVFDKLKISLVSNRVIVGKKGFLYLGNKYNNVIRKTQNFYRYKDSSIDKWTDSLKNLQTWYEGKGIQFVFVIAPNKHTIYPEYLPDWVEYKGNLTDEVFNSAKGKGVNLLDIRPHLFDRKKKNNELLYLRSDSHWNRVGGSIAFNETINFLNKKYQSNIKIPTYFFQIHNPYIGGNGLADLLKIRSKLPNNYENEIKVHFKKSNQICLGDIDDENFEMLKCVDKKNPSFSISKKAKYTTNQEAINNINMLMITDSFATNNSQLYSNTFQNLWKGHHNKLKGNNLIKIVDKYRPAIVIYQIVERNFYSLNYFNHISDIKVVENISFKTSNKIFDLLDKRFKFVKNKHIKIKGRQLLIEGNDPILILKYTKTTASMVLLKVQIESPHITKLQLFYKNKSDLFHSEKNTFSHPIKKGSNEIMIELPAKYINQGLRIDISNKVGNYQINEFSIFNLK